jgi:putative proteasome-type protease
MTYCVAMKLATGLVFLADTRTNAGVDQVSTFRKLTVFERPGDRLFALLSAGNLAITQAVRQLVFERNNARCGADGGDGGGADGGDGGGTDRGDDSGDSSGAGSLWSARTIHDAVRIVGEAVREVRRRDAQALKDAGIEFQCSFLFGGQVEGQAMALFHVYAAGNFIEATPENPYFQIGESKYGKPILDRILEPGTPLAEAAKCALISMDSTLRSNISVGLPLDLLVYEEGSLRVTRFVQIGEDNPYMRMIRSTWGARLRQVFAEIPDPLWRGDDEGSGNPRLETAASAPVYAPAPSSGPATP